MCYGCNMCEYQDPAVYHKDIAWEVLEKLERQELQEQTEICYLEHEQFLRSQYVLYWVA